MRSPRMLQFARTYRLETLKKSLNLVGPTAVIGELPAAQIFQQYPHLRSPLTKGTNADGLVMLTDLTPFSSIVADWDSDDIAAFLDAYYLIAVPVISAAGGVVEKYIGDGIVSLFGAPFAGVTTAVPQLRKAIDAALTLVKIVSDLFCGEIEVKSSLAYGRSFFGYVGPEDHRELTIVGNAMTMAFRLEEHAPPSSLILPTALLQAADLPFTSGPAPFLASQAILALRGVSPPLTPVTIIEQDRNRGGDQPASWVR